MHFLHQIFNNFKSILKHTGNSDVAANKMCAVTLKVVRSFLKKRLMFSFTFT